MLPQWLNLEEIVKGVVEYIIFVCVIYILMFCIKSSALPLSLLLQKTRRKYNFDSNSVPVAMVTAVCLLSDPLFFPFFIAVDCYVEDM